MWNTLVCMGNTMNPHGVGASGGGAKDVTSICPCCGAEHVWRAGPQMLGMRPPCSNCKRHDLSTPEGEIVALREHHERLPRLLEKARQAAREAKRAEAHALADAREKRRLTAKALDSRDRYKEIVEAVEREPSCHAGPTIELVRAEQRKRGGEDYEAYLDRL